MKSSVTVFARRIWLLLLLSMTQMVVWAQDSTGSSSSVTVTKETTTTTTDWYTQPWVWVVGGAVFLIILIALLRGNSSNTRDKEVSRTTVIKDRDY